MRRLVFVAVFAAACGGDSTAPSTKPASNGDQWSTVADWQMTLGNSRNTAYVPVTLDPAGFKLAWTSTGSVRAATRGTVLTYASGIASGTGRSEVRGLDAATGTARWTHSVATADQGITGVSLADGAGYFITWGSTTGSSFWRVDPKTGVGAPLTTLPFGGAWTTIVFSGSKAISMTESGGGGIYAFDRTTGLGQFISRAGKGSVWGVAGLDGAVATFGAFDANGTIDRGFTRLDVSSGATLVTVSSASMLPGAVTTVTDGGTAIGIDFSGHIAAVNVATGALRWSRSTSLQQFGRAAANGVVYGWSGTTVDAISEENGATLWQWQAASPFPRHGVVTKNLLFTYTADTTYAVDLQTHQTVWKYPFGAGGGMAISPDGLLLISGDPGRYTTPPLVAISIR